MIQELDSVVLTTGLPDYGLEEGDIGAVVLVHGDGKGYEVEFVTLDGETVAVVSLFPSQIRPIGRREIAHARLVQSALQQRQLAPGGHLRALRPLAGCPPFLQPPQSLRFTVFLGRYAWHGQGPFAFAP